MESVNITKLGEKQFLILEKIKNSFDLKKLFIFGKLLFNSKSIIAPRLTLSRPCTLVR